VNTGVFPTPPLIQEPKSMRALDEEYHKLYMSMKYAYGKSIYKIEEAARWSHSEGVETRIGLP
jgi:hypothetical protein